MVLFRGSGSVLFRLMPYSKTSHCFAFDSFEKGGYILLTLDKRTSLSVLKRKQLKKKIWIESTSPQIHLSVCDKLIAKP